MQPTDLISLPGIFLPYIWWIIPLIMIVLLFRSVFFKIILNKLSADSKAQCTLEDRIYQEFKELQILFDGLNEQIDYVYLSRFGIFVVATPDYQGRIWGSNGQKQWMYQFFNIKNVFENPLWKNQKYIMVLSEQLKLSPRVFYSVVVFKNSCRFQTIMPDNVLLSSGFSEYIAQYDDEVLSDDELVRVKTLLEGNEFDVIFKK